MLIWLLSSVLETRPLKCRRAILSALSVTIYRLYLFIHSQAVKLFHIMAIYRYIPLHLPSCESLSYWRLFELIFKQRIIVLYPFPTPYLDTLIGYKSETMCSNIKASSVATTLRALSMGMQCMLLFGKSNVV